MNQWGYSPRDIGKASGPLDPWTPVPPVPTIFDGTTLRNLHNTHDQHLFLVPWGSRWVWVKFYCHIRPQTCIALFSIAVPNYLSFRPSSPGCLCYQKKNHAKSSLHTTNHQATRNPWPQRPRTVHESLIYTGVVWNSTVRCHNKETDLLTKNDGLNPKTLPLQFIFAFGSQFGLAPSRWFEIPFHGCRYSGQLWYDQCGFFWWAIQASRFSC